MNSLTKFAQYFSFLFHFLYIHYAAVHGTVARKIATHPKRVLVVCTLILLLSCFGFFRFQSEKKVRSLYLPQNSKSELALKETGKYFINALNSRKESILLTVKPGYSVFQPTCVIEGKNIVDQFLNDSEFQNLCYRRWPSLANTSYYDQNQLCYVLNPLEIVRNTTNARSEASQALQREGILMSNGKLPRENVDSMFSTKTKGSLPDYESLKIDLYLKNREESKEDMDMVLAWEEQFAVKMKHYAESSSCFTVRYSSARSIDDEIGGISTRDRSLIFLCLALFLLLSFVITVHYKGMSVHALVFSVLGWLSIVLALFASYGLSVLFSVSFSNIEYALPLLCFMHALQVKLWLLEELRRHNRVMLHSVQIANTVRNIGPVISTVTFMIACAFAVCAASSFPAVRNYCIFGLIVSLTQYFLCFPILLSLLSIGREITYSTLEEIKLESNPACSPSQTPSHPNGKENTIIKQITKIIVSRGGCVFGLVLSSGLLAIGVYGCTQIKTTFLEKDLLQVDSEAFRYVDHYNTNFKLPISVSLVYSGELNYFDPTVQGKILNAHSLAINLDNYISQSEPWLSAFRAWNLDTRNNFSQSMHGDIVLAFLSAPNYTRYQRDVYVQQSNILASRTKVVMKEFSDQHSRREAMEELRKNLKNVKIPMYAVADEFLTLEHSAVIKSEIIKIVCLLLLVVSIVPSLVCIYSLVNFLALVSFAACLTELVGLMGLVGISLNSLTILNLVSSVTLAAGQTIYLSNKFALSNQDDAMDRLMTALRSTFPIMAALSCTLLLAMVLAWFLHNKPLLIYFSLLFACTIIGILANTLLLPPLLTLLNWLWRTDVNVYLQRQAHRDINGIDRKKKKGGVRSRSNESDPFISVVGISARFPTARTKDEYWQLLVEGRNTLSDYPLQRRSSWSDFMKYFNPSRGVKGRLYVTAGSYLEDIDLFDNNFFGISQSEAEMMDPQQRILIQGVFEAVEDAGLTLQDIQAVNTGVYVGSMNQDYASNINSTDKFDRNQFTGTGTSSAIIANRISFALNLKGPSVTVDTACSSSSTALSFAYEHLKSGKCDIAIVGASNIIVDKDKHMIICQAKMLAPDGQSKAFDARGDGYGRGEGMVVVVLKLNPRSNTRNQNAYCNILACNVNNDGQSAIPITAPSVEGQSRLFQITCMEAGINPESVSYLEAHGTGTVVGDRVETQSISLAYCQNRSSKNPLRVGSVKSNINHTESVAGLAGLAKVCLMMEHKKFVPTVGIKELNPDLDLERRALHVQQKYEDWPDDPKGHLRTAAVNSFGFGGSNAHMIVQELMKSTLKARMQYENQGFQGYEEEFYVLVLSARTKSALQQQAKVLSDWILKQTMTPSLSLDLCYSLIERRTKHNYRMAMGFQNLKDSAFDLQAFSTGEVNADTSHRISSDRVRHSSPLIGFVFGGQGSDLSGLVENLSSCNLLQGYFDLVDSEVKNCSTGPSLLREIRRLNLTRGSKHDLRAQESFSDLTNHQLTIFKVQYGIAKLLMEKCGITPTAALGHSLGDVTAACVSGCISLSNAVGLIIVRAELQNLCREDGKMAAVGISSTEMKDILEKLSLVEKVNIAAINDDTNITISGDADGLAKVEAYLTENRETVFWRYLKTAKAYHSHHMASIEDVFMKYMRKIKFKSQWSSTQFISSVHAKLMSASELSEPYWWQNIRRSVDFLGAVKELFNLDCQVVIEISATPVVQNYLKNISQGFTPVVQNYLKNISQGFTSETQGRVIDVMSAMPRAKVSEKVRYLLAHCVGQLFNIGCPVNFGTLMNFAAAKFVRYPTYAWQETKFWYKEPEVMNEQRQHLIGDIQASDSDRVRVYMSEIDTYKTPFLTDHKLKDIGTAFPGAGYVEMMLKAALGSNELRSLVMEEVTFDNILALPENVVKQVRTTVEGTETSKFKMNVVEVAESKDILLSSCRVKFFEDQRKGGVLGQLISSTAGSPRISYEITQIQSNAERTANADEMHKIVAGVGVLCGEAFSLLSQGWWGKGKFLSKLELPSSVSKDLASYVLHPSIIDASFQSASLAMSERKLGSVVPVGIGSLTLFPVGKAFRSLYCIVSNKSDKDQTRIQLLTEKGEVIFTVKDLKIVDLTNVPPKLSLEKSMYEMDIVPGITEDLLGSTSIGNYRWIVTGFKAGTYHQAFCDFLQSSIMKKEDLVVIEVDENSSNIKIASSIAKVMESQRKNVVVNFVPCDFDNKSDNCNDIQVTILSLFNNCLQDICTLLAREDTDITMEFVTSESIHSWRLISDEKCKSPKYPIASVIWGYTKALRLEWPSRRIQCADISGNPSPTEMKLLAAHCINDSTEPEILIRKNECYFPRLSLASKDGSRNMNLIPCQQLCSRPHYLVMAAPEGNVAVIEDKGSCTVAADEIVISTTLATGILGNLNSLQVNDQNAVTAASQPVACYGATIVNKEERQQKSNFGNKFLVFRTGARLYSRLKVKSAEVAKVPEWMTLEQAVASAGCLVVASRILKTVQRCLIRCQRCLVTSNKENLEVAFATMLVGRELGMEVYTNCTSFDEKMSSVGINFMSTYDIGEECEGYFDCLIDFNYSFSHDMETLESSISFKGCILLVENGSTDNSLKNIVLANIKRKIPCYMFDCSNVAAKDLAEEWSGLLPGVLKQISVFSALLNIDIDVHDPYTGVAAPPEKEGLTFNLLRMNSSGRETLRISKSSVDYLGFKANKTYLVIGGHKGLGMETSMWLLNNGASHVITCGRSALPKGLEENYSLVAKKKGVLFEHVACDVTKSDGIDKLRTRLTELPPLAGIINSAVVYDDRVSQDVDFASFNKVTGPKVLGTILLYEMVREMNVELEFFILYSSIASTVGNLGQASYCAGNFFMNEFANRMSLLTGDHFLAVCWGPMGDAGYLSEHEDVAQVITEKLGLHIIPIKTGLQWLKTVLMHHPVLSTVILNSFDWTKMTNKNNPLRTCAVIKHLMPSTISKAADTDQGPLGILKGFSTAEERWNFLSEYMKNWFARWLGTAEISEVDLNSPLSQYGIDSGGAMGFQTTIENDFEVNIPIYELLRPDSSGMALVSKIIKEIDFEEAKPTNLTESTGNNDKESLSSDDSSSGSNQAKVDEDQNSDVYISGLENFCAVAHSPPKALANFFWLHSTHRFRGHMLSVAEGFKCQDVFRIYSIGSDDLYYKARVKEDVHSLAKTYVRLITRIQPRGPYFIGGFSFGGLLALEMASILKERREIVAMLVMVDTFPWISETFAVEKHFMNHLPADQFVNTKYFLGSFFRATALYKLGLQEEEYNEIFVSHDADSLANYLHEVAENKRIPVPDLRLLCESVNHNVAVTWAAVDSWQPPKVIYNGPLLFVEAQNKRFTPHLPTWERNSYAWRDLIQPRQFYLHTVDSDHHSIIQKRNGVEIGKLVSTMSRFVLKQNFPDLNGYELSPVDHYSVQALSEGFHTFLGIGKRSLQGTIRANIQRRKLKFKSKSKSKLEGQHKIKLHFRDIVNVVKADSCDSSLHSVTTMGVVIWARNKQFAFYFQSWLEYNRVILGLQSVLGIRLPLLQ